MAKITIDGVQYEVEDGLTILQAMDRLEILMRGVDIPHYCWHPKLSIDGSCRLCQVEIVGQPKLQIGCNTAVRDGMEVITKSERVKRAREGVMELLLIHHPLDCPICDQAGECKLQDYAYDYGLPHARTIEPRRARKKKVEIGPRVVFDQERCILCRRCVRFTREISKTGELAVFNRGEASVLDTFPGTPLDNPYSVNVVDICPVGALTSKDYRFQIRTWFLKDVPSVCPGCSNGCNINAGTARGKVYRYTPRRNDEVNDTWICDAGRLSYHEIGAPDRLQFALVRSTEGLLEEVPLERAFADAAARLRKLIDKKGAGVIAGVASPHATNESLLIFQNLLSALGVKLSGVAVAMGESDTFLIKAEKAANIEGARRLGFPEIAKVVERVRGGGIDGLIVLGHELLTALDAEALSKLDTVIVLDTHRSPLERVAHVVLPVRHALEQCGTLTNHAGRVQKIEAAVEPAWEAYTDGETLVRLGAWLGLDAFREPYDASKVSQQLETSNKAFAGRNLDSVGEHGLLLAKGDA